MCIISPLLLVMDPRLQHRSESEGFDAVGPDLAGPTPDLVRNASFPLASPRAAKKTWKVAALKTRDLPDPWAGFQLDAIPEERAIRHMYDPKTGQWREDEIVIKLQSEVYCTLPPCDGVEVSFLKRLIPHRGSLTEL